MARPVDLARRQELLGLAVDYAIVHGLADLSLRPLADGLGTQASVLLHHFGSKEQLLVLILNGVRERVRALARDAADEQGRGGLLATWVWAADPERDPLVRLYFEGYALALRRPDLFAGFLEADVRDWLGDFPAPIDEASATVAVAAVRGLLLDLLATGDRPRVEAAMERTIAMLWADADRRQRSGADQ